MELGKNLKRLRQFNQYTLSYAALEFGITPEELTRYEDGEATPSVTVAQAMAALYQLPDLESLLFRPIHRLNDEDLAGFIEIGF